MTFGFLVVAFGFLVVTGLGVLGFGSGGGGGCVRGSGSSGTSDSHPKMIKIMALLNRQMFLQYFSEIRSLFRNSESPRVPGIHFHFSFLLYFSFGDLFFFLSFSLLYRVLE